MSNIKKPPKQKAVVNEAPMVRVMNVQPMAVLPRAIGYGIAEPVRTWKAVSQVKGEVIYSYPQLQKGKLVLKGQKLLTIDPAEYKIRIAQLKASIRNFEIQIRQTNVQKKNNLKLLKLQKESLKFTQSDVERQKKLLDRKVSSRTEYESKLKASVAQEVQVQNIQNSLNLVPVQIDLLKTQLEKARGDLASAELQLSFTVITAPFDVQISKVNSRLTEFVQAGQTLIEGNDISNMEIEAHFIRRTVVPVFRPLREKMGKLDLTQASLGKFLGAQAVVKIPGSQGTSQTWDADLNRMSDAVDAETRTIAWIVIVKNQWGGKNSNEKSPLLKGNYCEVEIRGEIEKDRLVIPRNALHPGNIVYLMTPENKLEKRKIEPLYTMSDLMVVKRGIKAGETLILSDVIPAVTGMEVDSVIDKTAIAKLVKDARGE